MAKVKRSVEEGFGSPFHSMLMNQQNIAKFTY